MGSLLPLMSSIFSRIFGKAGNSSAGEAGLPPLIARLLGGKASGKSGNGNAKPNGGYYQPSSARSLSPQYRSDYSSSDTSTWTYPHRDVISSNLSSVAYDYPSQQLEVRFHSASKNTTGSCRYSGVPLAIYSGLMHASSKGKFHHALIRDKYPFTYV